MRHGQLASDENSQIDWKALKQLKPYLVEFKGRMILALVFMTLAKLCTIALPFILKLIVDGMSAPANPVASDLLSTIPVVLLTPLALVIAYGMFRLVNVVFGEIRDTLFSRVTERTIRRTSLRIFQHLHDLDVEFHLDRRTGGLARDIERGTHGINFIMRFMVINIIPTFIEISLVVGILLFNFGIWFGLITAASIIIYIAFSVVVTNWRNQYVRATNDADSNSSTRAIDSLLNYETVKYFTNEDYESQRYDQDLAIWEKAKTKNRLSLFALNSGQALIISAAVTALLYLSVMRVSQNEMTIGDFVLVNAFIMQLFMPLNFLGFIYREIRVAFINIEKMFVLLKRQPIVADIPQAQTFDQFDEPIEFEDVQFGYDPSRQVLAGINLLIEPNKTTAIVGSSGSGKSSLVKLLLRFYDPTAGVIRIGNQKLTEVTLHSLRKHIGIVPQDTVLFNDTIMENIRYGNPKASDDDVYKAIKMAHLDEFISKLAKGTSTLVGERGLKLSGGEKQRVAIARALLKNPPIMIFDEATSSLDSHSEKAILQAIDEISAKYTSIFIAHRLSTIVNADKIVVLDQGTIVESGNHLSLLAKQGYYFRLWNAQQKNMEHAK